MVYNELEQEETLSCVRVRLATIASVDIFLCSIWAIHKIRQSPIRNLTQAGREDFRIKGAGMQISSGLAGLQNRAHGSVVTIMLFLFPTQALFVLDPPIGREQNYLESLLPESTKLIQRLQASTDGIPCFFPSEVLLPEVDAWLDG